MRLSYARVATLIALPLALISLIPSMVGLITLRHHATELELEVQARCEDSRVNRDAIRSTITDGLPTLGYRYEEEAGDIVPHGPPIDYYRTHPEEREQALARSRAALDRFPPIHCETHKEER